MKNKKIIKINLEAFKDNSVYFWAKLNTEKQYSLFQMFDVKASKFKGVI